MGTLFLTKEARRYNEVKIASSINDTGKIGQLHVKNEIRTLPNTIHEHKLKMNSRPKWKTRNFRTLRGKHRQNTQ